MKNDISRDTFNPAKHFMRVLMQQGRVQLDADVNEQTAIFWHYMWSLATDIIGPFGGPKVGIGFGILPGPLVVSHLTTLEQERIKKEDPFGTLLRTPPANGFSFGVTRGRYYVDGLLAENDADIFYNTFADYPNLNSADGFILYLDVWERHVSYVEDDSIREVALGGPDTATRSQLTWRIRVYTQEDENKRTQPAADGTKAKKPLSQYSPQEITSAWQDFANYLQPPNRGRLIASVKSSDGAANEPCIIHPDALYRGAENQLYRVEIHASGKANEATFKWSRENGSVTFPILEMIGGQARLAHLGRDNHLGLQVNDWVEVVDDNRALGSQAGPLFQVTEVRPMDSEVTLKAPTSGSVPEYRRTDQGQHPYLRRWDQRREVNANGVLAVKEKTPIMLEDNVQIQFAGQDGALYRAGDYWLIPARTVTGKVEWPLDENQQPLALPPRGVQHHYAPLALWSPLTGRTVVGGLSTDQPPNPNKDAAGASPQTKDVNPLQDLRLVFKSLTDTV